MKFYTYEDYSKLTDIDEAELKKQAMSGKIKSISLSKPLPNLILDPEDKETAIIAFSNLKGGCGKTTLSAHFAALLSKAGFNVLLIDTDHQNQCEAFFPIRSYETTILNALSNGSTLDECIYPVETKDSELDIVFSDYEIALFAQKFEDQNKLSKLIKSIKPKYDFIIIDTSPNFDIITQNAVRAATHIIIPIVPTNLHIRGLIHNLKGLEEIAEVDLRKVIGILPNIVNDAHRQQVNTMEMLNENEEFSHLMYQTYIKQSAEMSNITDFSTTIFDYKEKSRPSQDLKKVVWETLRRL